MKAAPMKLDTAAKRLAALGHEHRLELYRLLVRSGAQGLTVGEIQSLLRRPASTVAFHLRELVSAGLVVQHKEGRSVRCTLDFNAIDQVLQFIKQDCCRGIELPVFAQRRAA
jgi:ArsR family transcriptional regulator, arsenate/arsenite/antimonite-responsive transcriptional repressor